MRWGFLVVSSIGIAASWVGCLEPTQVTIEITTAYKPCGDTDTVIATGATTVKGPACVDKEVGGRVGTLVIVPRKSVNDAVLVQITAGVDGSKGEDCAKSPRPAGLSCIEAKRIVHFLSHRSFTLPIELDRSCVNVDCGPNTCVMGKCVNPDVPDPTCANDIRLCPMDAGPPSDSGIDTGIDTGPPAITATLLASGFDNACALASNNALYCWGDNTYQQITTQPVSKAGPTKVGTGSLGSIKSIAIGGGHICVSDGTQVGCWGNNKYGQAVPKLPGNPIPVNKPTVFSLPSQAVTTLVAGANFTCANGNSETDCWGQIGMVPYTPGAPISQNHQTIAAGEDHLLAITLGGDIEGLGGNAYGQLTYDSQTPYVGPNVQPLKYTFVNASAIYAGYAHSAALDANNHLAWGNNKAKELAPLNAATSLYQPVKFAPGDAAFGIAHVCVLENNLVRCRGDNTAGQCGNSINPDVDNFLPVALTNGDPAAAIVAGRVHSCARTKLGTIWCWGAAPVGPGSGKPTVVTLQ